MLEDYQLTDEHVNPPEFVFANVHGELQVKFKNKSRFGLMVTFHSINQLVHIIREAQTDPADDEYERVSSWADRNVDNDNDDMGFNQMM